MLHEIHKAIKKTFQKIIEETMKFFFDHHTIMTSTDGPIEHVHIEKCVRVLKLKSEI